MTSVESGEGCPSHFLLHKMLCLFFGPDQREVGDLQNEMQQYALFTFLSRYLYARGRWGILRLIIEWFPFGSKKETFVPMPWRSLELNNPKICLVVNTPPAEIRSLIIADMIGLFRERA
ncbi:hypothetical protein CsSME_00008666 [Camellia sinensis var. sinensis]